MRDWNYSVAYWWMLPSISFQHTYEGLKHVAESLCNSSRESFQHTYEGLKPSTRCMEMCGWLSFSAYLWGIETAFAGWAAPGLPFVFSIPMRDWNNTFWANNGWGTLGFQHTYEGLKPPMVVRYIAKTKGFQHTYEGLKLESAAHPPGGSVWFSAYLWGIETTQFQQNIEPVLHRFQHTYEGLKLETDQTSQVVVSGFSAYLWGIETNFNAVHHSPHGSVFSIPMRDWNIQIRMRMVMWLIVFSIPMRDWNWYKYWGILFF